MCKWIAESEYERIVHNKIYKDQVVPNQGLYLHKYKHMNWSKNFNKLRVMSVPYQNVF